MVNNQMSNSKFSTDAYISENWDGGYKLELDLTAESNNSNWTLDFSLPYTITEIYGVDLIDNGNGNYTIKGQNDQSSLEEGQSIKSVLIIDDNGQEALTPEFNNTSSSSSVTAAAPVETIEQPLVDDIAAPLETMTGDTAIADLASEPVEIPEIEAQSSQQESQFAYGEALQLSYLFYEANESGELTEGNRLTWRDDSTLNDGSTVGRDLEGGYFDAGDHVKFGQPMAFSMTTLAWGGIEYEEAYKQSGQYDELLESVKHGTDYFLKAHEMDSQGNTERLWVQVGEGGYNNDHGYWGSPESVEANTTRNAFAIDAQNPGTDVAASTAASLASASMLFRDTDPAYADQLLKEAVALYDFAETYQGSYSDSVSAANPYYTSWSGYGDELSYGAAWLYKATGEESYLSKSENYFKNEVGGLGDWSMASDDQSYGAAVILAQESDDPYFQNEVEGWLDGWVAGEGNVNYTDDGFAHRAEWASVPVTSSTAYLAELYSDTVEYNESYSNFATDQVDYILGDNSQDYSYMVGFGDNYPERTHHRGSAGSQPLDGGSTPNDNILYGAVVGGPSEPNDYSHNDQRNDWVTNEVGTSYNAPLTSALVQQYDNYGGDPLTDSELDDLVGVDTNGDGI